MTAHIPTAHEVETYSGMYVDTQHPDPKTINLRDVAHALSNTCRYGGHCQQFYSVAEHAVFVSKRLEAKGASLIVQLAGLHHDDAEAYLGDIPRPLKPLLGDAYTELTDTMDQAIVDGLGLYWFGLRQAAEFHTKPVKRADNFALFVEARHLLPSRGLHWFKGEQGASAWGLGEQPKRIHTPPYWKGGLNPPRARQLFIERHDELTQHRTLGPQA